MIAGVGKRNFGTPDMAAYGNAIESASSCGGLRCPFRRNVFTIAARKPLRLSNTRQFTSPRTRRDEFAFGVNAAMKRPVENNK
jgi:hypothetical protein